MAVKRWMASHPWVAWGALAVVAMVLAVGGAWQLGRMSVPGDTLAVAGTGGATLEQLEAILRDRDRDAERRIDEALKELRKRHERASDPFDEAWDPFASPFADEWDPWRKMQRMQREMDRLFDGVLTQLHQQAPPGMRDEALLWSPRGEFEEREDAYVYRFDLPGVDPTQVDVTVEDGTLIVEGRRGSQLQESDDERSRFRREIRHGRFRRVIALPDDVDPDGSMETRLEDGVLTVVVKKQTDAPASRKE